MKVLDINIPANLKMPKTEYVDNAKDLYISLVERYEPFDVGYGFGFFSVQIECDDEEMAQAIVEEIKNDFSISLLDTQYDSNVNSAVYGIYDEEDFNEEED